MRTRRTLAWITAALVLSSCSGIDLPSTEESAKKIARLKPQIEVADKAIAAAQAPAPMRSDFHSKLRMETLNKILGAVAGSRSDDVRAMFLQTRPLLKENKDVLGLKYTNNLDIDTGTVRLNLKTLRFESFSHGKLDATLELEGKGNITVSGYYMGVPAKVSPDVNLYLNERISFTLAATDSGYMVLKPVPKTLKLKTGISIKLLQWHVPYSHDVDLQLTDLIPSMAFPLALVSELNLPIPAKTFDKNKPMEYEKRKIETSRTVLNVDKNVIVIDSQIGIRK